MEVIRFITAHKIDKAWRIFLFDLFDVLKIMQLRHGTSLWLNKLFPYVFILNTGKANSDKEIEHWLCVSISPRQYFTCLPILPFEILTCFFLKSWKCILKLHLLDIPYTTHLPWVLRTKFRKLTLTAINTVRQFQCRHLLPINKAEYNISWLFNLLNQKYLYKY